MLLQILLEGRTKVICFEAAQEDTIKVSKATHLKPVTLHGTVSTSSRNYNTPSPYYKV